MLLLLLLLSQSTVVLLEEPEHLNWYRCSGRWSSEYQHVVGVLHTDYSGYAADLPGWLINKAAVGLVCRVVCRLHCHKVCCLWSASSMVNVGTTLTCSFAGKWERRTVLPTTLAALTSHIEQRCGDLSSGWRNRLRCGRNLVLCRHCLLLVPIIVL